MLSIFITAMVLKPAIKPKKDTRTDPVGITMYPHMDDPRIKVLYTNQDISHDFEMANTENSSSRELLTIQI